MLDWSEQDKLVEKAVGDYVDQHIRPISQELDTGEVSPYPVIRNLFATFGIDAMAREMFTKSIDRQEAAEVDGRDARGLDDTTAAARSTMMMMVLKELSKVDLGLVTTIGANTGLSGMTIMTRGTAEQKRRWGIDLMTFDKIGCWAMTEPGSGSDAFGGMLSTARPEGNGWLLNGSKTFITNAADADTIVFFCKLATSPDEDPRNRPILTFVVDGDMEGVTRPKPFRKMGIHSTRTGELFLEDVYVDESRLLGGRAALAGKGEGRGAGKDTFTIEKTGAAAMALGIIEECLSLSVEYAKTCERWGKPIGEYQLIQLKLANMEIARTNVRNMVLRFIEMQREGHAIGWKEASVMKVFAAQQATAVAYDAVQLFGGNGYMSEYHVEKLARDAKILQIYGGTDEMQITRIARELLTEG